LISTGPLSDALVVEARANGNEGSTPALGDAQLIEEYPAVAGHGADTAGPVVPG
jgi:hypothetical protein